MNEPSTKLGEDGNSKKRTTKENEGNQEEWREKEKEKKSEHVTNSRNKNDR